MCDESEVMFYGMNLWSFHDSAISTNSLNFDYYAYSKSGRLASPKFKIAVYGRAAEGSKVNLGSSDLYRFSYMLKSKILKLVKPTIDQMKQDQNHSIGFVYNGGHGKNIYVTLMWSPLSNDAVVRFMIGEKEKTILDSDKVYIPVIEFFSLCEILDQAFKNYITLCSTVVQDNNLKKIYDLLDTKEFVVPQFQPRTDELIPGPKLHVEEISLPDPVIAPVAEAPKPGEEFQKVVEAVSISPESIGVEEKPVETPKEIENISKTETEKEGSEGQNDFDDFLKNNRDSMELDMAKPIEQLIAEEKGIQVEQPSNVEEITVTSKFIDKVCENDFSKLEEIIINSCNEDLPFDSFVNIVKKFTDIDFHDGIDEKEYCAVNYCISRQVKTRVGLLLEKQIKLPASTAPIIVKNSKRSNDKLDTTYYLLLFYIYMSKIRTALNDKTNNSIDNKDLFTYLLKMVTNPLVFAYIPDSACDVTKNELNRRYRDLRDKGFFNKFVEGIKGKIFGAEFNIDYKDIEEAVDKIYANVTKFGDKLNPSILFDKDFMKLTYEDFKQELTIENVRKIVHFDSAMFKFKKIDLQAMNIKSTDDLPVWVTNKFGIKTTKFDTTIIQKYFQDNYKGNSQLEHISKINKNVYDIIDLLDLTEFDDNALKALYFWDTEQLPKTLTYQQFKMMIEKSSLEKSQLVSMIVNREKTVDPTFFMSFVVSAEDPFES